MLARRNLSGVASADEYALEEEFAMTTQQPQEHTYIGLGGDAEMSACLWKERTATRPSNGNVAVHILHDGGLLAAFGRTRPDGSLSENVLWESPWIEPMRQREEQDLIAQYGDLGSGRFLENFTGHALCLDGFGPATVEEVERGSGLHGEASIVRWKVSSEQNGVRATAELPLASLRVERHFELLSDETVVRVHERTTDTSLQNRAIQSVQHATVGQPFFDATCLVSSLATREVTAAQGYEGCETLLPSASFVWSLTPAGNGTDWDLRKLFGHPSAGV